MSYAQEVTISFELELGLGIEISVVKSDSSINNSTRSKFKLGEDTGLKFWK